MIAAYTVHISSLSSKGKDMRIDVVSYCKKIKGVTVLDNINYSFESGKVYGLQGKNGSGKTMLLRAVSGLIFPTSGYASVNGQVLGTDIAFPRSIGLLIENPSFIGKYTGIKNLTMLAGIRNKVGKDEVADALIKVGLDPKDRRPYRKYSLGMKQRLAIACAIMERPRVILLDEPINALDPSGVECVERILCEKKKEGALVIIACHDKSEMRELADVVITLAEGRIVSSEAVAV